MLSFFFRAFRVQIKINERVGERRVSQGFHFDSSRSPVIRVVMNWRFWLPSMPGVLPQSGLYWTTTLLLCISITIKHRVEYAKSEFSANSCLRRSTKGEEDTDNNHNAQAADNCFSGGLRFNEECEWVAVLARTKGTINWITEMCAIVVVGKGEELAYTASTTGRVGGWLQFRDGAVQLSTSRRSLRTLSSARTRSINAEATLHLARSRCRESPIFFYF